MSTAVTLSTGIPVPASDICGCEEIEAAINTLTDVERKHVADLVSGYLDDEIALRHDVSAEAVNLSLASAATKLGAHGRADMVRMVMCVILKSQVDMICESNYASKFWAGNVRRRFS